MWDHSPHFSSWKFILETRGTKPLFWAILLLSTSPALNPPACFGEHSWSTADFPVTELPNKLHGSTRWFCFQTNRNFMDWSEIFLFFLSQGQLPELSRLGKLQKHSPRSSIPPAWSLNFSLGEYFYILLEIQDGFTMRKKFEKTTKKLNKWLVLVLHWQPFPEESQVLCFPEASEHSINSFHPGAMKCWIPWQSSAWEFTSRAAVIKPQLRSALSHLFGCLIKQHFCATPITKQAGWDGGSQLTTGPTPTIPSGNVQCAGRSDLTRQVMLAGDLPLLYCLLHMYIWQIFPS